MQLVITGPSLTGLESELVYRLKLCYLDIFLEDKVTNCDNWFIEAIEESILQGNYDLQELFRTNSDCQYSADKDNSIFSKFMQKIEPLMNSTYHLAYSIQTHFNASTDLVGILLPYILLKTEIGNEDIDLFIGIGVLIAQLIIQHLADRETKKMETERNDSIEIICRNNILLLQQLSEKEDADQEIIKQCLGANSNMLNILQNKK